jgi:hypothetical protein
LIDVSCHFFQLVIPCTRSHFRCSHGPSATRPKESAARVAGRVTVAGVWTTCITLRLPPCPFLPKTGEHFTFVCVCFLRLSLYVFGSARMVRCVSGYVYTCLFVCVCVCVCATPGWRVLIFSLAFNSRAWTIVNSMVLTLGQPFVAVL